MSCCQSFGGVGLHSSRGDGANRFRLTRDSTRISPSLGCRARLLLARLALYCATPLSPTTIVLGQVCLATTSRNRYRSTYHINLKSSMST